MRTSDPSHTRFKKLLVSFDSEVRKRRCRKNDTNFGIGTLVRFARAVSLIAAALLAFAGSAGAQDFYAGKTLTVVAGFPPGGGVDGEMRVLTRHLARYIPGQPTIVARNMPGAGGIGPTNAPNNSAAAAGS